MIRFLQRPGKAKKVVLGGILLVICIALVITLIPGFLDFSGALTDQGVIAKVGAQTITDQEVMNFARQMAARQFGQNIPSQITQMMAPRAAESLIVRQAVVEEARRLGFTVSDQELAEQLRRMAEQLVPERQNMSQQEYLSVIRNFIQREHRMTLPQFEERIREEMLLERMRTAITGAVTVSDAELQEQYKTQNTKVKFQYAVLSTQDLMKQIRPTDAELRAWFDANKSRYTNSIPEQRQARYVVLDTSTIREKVQVTKEDLQRAYDARRDEFRLPERIKVSHIAVKLPSPGPDGKLDDKAVSAARTKADGILKQLRSGARFDALAKKLSDDRDSAKQGGSLGWKERGQMPYAEFENAAFALQKGQTSEVVRTSYGFHIIRVDDREPARIKPLEEVRDVLEPNLRQERAEQQIETLASTLETEARASGLDKAATSRGLEVITTGWVSRTDVLPGVGMAPELMDSVFGVNAKSPPQRERTPQGYVIFEVTQVRPARTPTFEEVRAQVESSFKSERAQQMLNQKGQQLADRARALHNLAAAAKEVGATVKTSELVTRESVVPDLGNMSGPASVAFTMQRGQINGPIASGQSAAVISLLEKQEPATKDFAKSKPEFRDRLLGEKRNQTFTLFAYNLKDTMQKAGKIRVNEQELKRISGGSGTGSL